MGAMKELEVNNLVGNFSAAGSVSKNLTRCVCNVSPITCYRSRCSITYSTTSKKTDFMPFCAFWNTSRESRSGTLQL